MNFMLWRYAAGECKYVGKGPSLEVISNLIGKLPIGTVFGIGFGPLVHVKGIRE